MKTERFKAEKDAMAFANKWSKANKTTLYVIDSPNLELPDPSLRFVVDNDSMIRNFERLVSFYTNGKQDIFGSCCP